MISVCISTSFKTVAQCLSEYRVAEELPVASCSLVRERCEGQWTAVCSPAVGGVYNRALAAVGNLLQGGVGSPQGVGGNQ